MGMLGKFVSKKKANIRKGKGKKKRNKGNPTIIFFWGKRGWWTKSKENKWNFEREDKKENQKIKQNRKKRRILKTGLSGEQFFKPLKLQENSLFGPFYKTQAQKHRGKKTKKTPRNKKTDQKKPFGIMANNPLLLVNVCLFQVTLFHVCKAVVCWKHHKNSVLSRAQLLGITDSKAPFEAPSQNGTFATKSSILGFPLCLLKPLFL